MSNLNSGLTNINSINSLNSGNSVNTVNSINSISSINSINQVNANITTPTTSISNVSTPYSLSSTGHQPPNIPRPNLTPYNFQNMYNQHLQFQQQQQHHSNDHFLKQQNDQFMKQQQQQNDQFLTYSHDSTQSTSDTNMMQPGEMAQITSPITTQHGQPQPGPHGQGILLSPAISSGVQYVHQSYLPPIHPQVPVTTTNLGNMNPISNMTAANMGTITNMTTANMNSMNANSMSNPINTLVSHRRTRVFWSRRDMDNLITWIETNKPDCIGHGRRQDCERIKKEVFAHRTEFTAKTIKEKLLNMKKKYLQAKKIKNENENLEDVKIEDDNSNNNDDLSMSMGDENESGYNPRFEGLSLKDRVEKVCPFFDRIDRLKTQKRADLMADSNHNNNTPPSHSSIMDTPDLRDLREHGARGMGQGNTAGLSDLDDPMPSRVRGDRMLTGGSINSINDTSTASTQELVNRLERDSHVSRELLRRSDLEQQARAAELANTRLIEGMIKAVLPVFFSNSNLGGGATNNNGNTMGNLDLANVCLQSMAAQSVEPVSLSRSLEAVLNRAQEGNSSNIHHNNNPSNMDNDYSQDNLHHHRASPETLQEDQAIIASALAAAVAAFAATVKLGHGVLSKRGAKGGNSNVGESNAGAQTGNPNVETGTSVGI